MIEWKIINNLDDYKINNQGIIKSCKFKKEKFLKLQTDSE